MISHKQQQQLDEISRFNQIRDARQCAACASSKATGYPLCLSCLMTLDFTTRAALLNPRDMAEYFSAHASAIQRIKETGNGRKTAEQCCYGAVS